MEPDNQTFDLFEALTGINYPEHSVPVVFDGALSFAISTLKEALDLAIAGGLTERAEAVQKELDETLKHAKTQMYRIHFRGIPEIQRENIIREVEEIFPTQRNLLGQSEPNIQADNELRRRMWIAYITKIENPEGKVSVPDENSIDALINHLDSSAHEKISEGISELITGTKSGFEAAIKDTDFLSEPSPEE